ncbi:MAG TPA: hypothetical protein VN892_12780 [Solirubrobacteraceae bacterium]|nr:hypothetical protein [Solirubrobacteraceae bacterium]
MTTPNEERRDVTPAFTRDAIRFIIYFTIIAGVVTFIGVVAGATDHNVVLAVGTCVVVVIVEVAMMLVMRKRAMGRRSTSWGATRTDVAESRMLSATLLASSGVLMGAVCGFVIVAHVLNVWIAAVIGVIGGLLLLVAGYHTQKRFRRTSLEE